MHATLGVIALIQVTFLPGLLLVRRFQLAHGFMPNLLLAFVLSLLVNFYLVFALTAAGWFRQPVLLALTAFTLLLLWLQERRRSIRFTVSPARWCGALRHRLGIAGTNPLTAAWRLALFGAALATLAYFGARAVLNVGQIFNLWDDVVSWNRWAVDWAQGRYPGHTWHYPQLLPAAWATTYVFMGTPAIQFFAKALMPLFPLFLILAQFDLWLRSGRAGYLAAMALTGFLLLFTNCVQGVTSGYADIPVTFMGFMPLYLLRARDREDQPVARAIFSGALCCAAAAVTKQAGLFILAAYPVLAWTLAGKGVAKPRPGQIAAAMLLAVALTLPWYAFSEYRIRAGHDTSEVKLVTNDTHQGRTLQQRLMVVPDTISRQVENSPLLDKGFRILSGTLLPGGKVALLLAAGLGLLVLASLALPGWRPVAAVVVLPYSLLWALYYSYDLRNISLVIPYAALATGFLLAPGGGEKRLPPPDSGTGGLPLAPLLAALFVAIAIAMATIGNETLLKRQLALQREITVPAVNRILYGLKEQEPAGKVLTSYQPAQYLPGLGGFYQLDDMVDPAALQRFATEGAISHMLFFKSLFSPTPEMRAYLERAREHGLLTSLPAPDGYLLYRVNRESRRAP
jgi:hypothetical protein